MAKRYGRNQKRAHREYIAELQAEVGRLTGAVAEREQMRAELAQALLPLEAEKSVIEKELRAMRGLIDRWDADVRHLLGEYSAFRLKTPTIHTDERVSRVPLPIPVELLVPDMALEAVEATVRMHVAELRRFLVTGKQNHQLLKQIVRLVVEDSRGDEVVHFNYAVDTREIMRIGARDRHDLIRHVATALFDAVERGSAHG